MRAGRGGSPHIKRLVTDYFLPITERVSKVVETGIAAGEFRQVNPRQFVTSSVAVITHYFLNIQLAKLALADDPLSPERVAERRAAVMDFVSSALFAPGERAPSQASNTIM